MPPKENNPLEEVRKTLQTESDEANRALREVTLMLQQSQGELTKITQRNAAITAHLQQVQAQGAKASLEELRMAYDSALDAQQRLFVMRGQLEKLQSDQTRLQHNKTQLDKINDLLNKPGEGGKGGAKSAQASIEGVIQAQEAERQRLSRQMHDGPAQALSNFILQTEIAMRLMDIEPSQARDELNSLKASAMSTFQKVRNFIFELRPMMLDDLGVVPTVRRYIDNFKEQQSGMEITLTVSGQERRLESYREVMIFRALQELLGNAARHSQATFIKILFDITDSAVKVTVDDNGKGFDTDVLQQGNSLGLNMIRDRVEMMGGVFELDSMTGRGTRVVFSIPGG